MPAGQSHAYNPEHRTASTSPTRVGSLRAPRRPNPKINGFAGCTRAHRRKTPPGSPKAVAAAMDDETKERSAPASPQEGHASADTSAAVESVLQRAAEQAQRTTTKKKYGPRDAYNVSVASLILTVCAFCAGLAISIHSSSSAALGYALENGVDAIGSVLVLWRFWGAGVISEAQLELREKRADVGIALMFVLLGWLVAINGMATLASHEEADNHSVLLGLSVPSAFLFGFLGFYKLRIASEVDSMALRKDGFCSLAGACLSCGGLIGYFLMVEASIWWADGVVALIVGFVLVVAGSMSLKKNLALRWWSRQFWVTEASRAATKRRARAEMSDLSDDRVDALSQKVDQARLDSVVGDSNLV